MDLEVDGGIVSLLIEDGGRVEIKGFGGGSMDLHCGAQEPRSVVVRFLPTENAESGTLGVIRTIKFTGQVRRIEAETRNRVQPRHRSGKPWF